MVPLISPITIPSNTLWWTNILPWKITIFNGKSTISMAIFNCYVSSPEGIEFGVAHWSQSTNIQKAARRTEILAAVLFQFEECSPITSHALWLCQPWHFWHWQSWRLWHGWWNYFYIEGWTTKAVEFVVTANTRWIQGRSFQQSTTEWYVRL